jgi:PAS domain S-box-containing protein
MGAEGTAGLLGPLLFDVVRAPLAWLLGLWPGASPVDAGSADLAIRGANDGLFVLDPATGTVSCWPRFVELLGYAEHPDECPRTIDTQALLLHPDDAPRATAAVQHSIETGEPFDCEYRVRRRDGAYRWFHGRGTRLVDADGAVRFAGCLTDISEHKRQAQLMEQASAAAHIGGWELDCVTQTLYWTPGTYRIHETSPDAYMPTLDSAIAFYAPESVPAISEAVRRGMEEGIGWDLELDLITARGRRIGVRATGLAERAGSRTLKLFGSFQDITEQRRAAQALRESEEKIRAILEHASSAVFVATPEGVFTYMSPPAQRLTGFEPAEYVGKTFGAFIHPDDLAANQAVVERVVRGRQAQATIEYRSRHKVGGWRWHSTTISLTGDGCGLIGVTKDVSARRDAEAERTELLARAQAACAQAEEASRLKDEFLATVSHELRTPLGPIIAWADLLSENALQPDEMVEALAAIRRNAHIQARLIEDILDVSRITSGKLRMQVGVIDLAAVIDAALDAVRLAAEAKSIRLVTRFDGEAAPIAGDATRLQQVLWNLLSNAIKFTPSGGQVEVAVRPSGARVVIEVRDTGEGIDADFLPHVFSSPAAASCWAWARRSARTSRSASASRGRGRTRACGSSCAPSAPSGRRGRRASGWSSAASSTPTR